MDKKPAADVSISGGLLEQARATMRRFNLRARKRLAQHFLIDEGVLQSIVDAAELNPTDIVVEVGPGLGVLTRELASRAGRVIAIELDDNLAAMLKETLAPSGNVSIVNADVLDIDPGAVLAEHGLEGTPYKVVANLPYYITQPALRHFLEAKVKPQMMLVMVQKEVAESITAKPGDMSILSSSVQFYGKPELVSYVPARCFFPIPQVDSAIVRIDLFPWPVVDIEPDSFFKVVRAGFRAARKQLANSLAQGLGRPKTETLALLAEAGIDPQRRAETLSLEEWASLWHALDNREKEA